LTTQRKCLRCGTQFWMSEHDGSFRAPETGKGYFCPTCLRKETEDSVARKLGILGYWCG
jgi:DNA-directed RNA polymerase subunit RPC12/RpoP